MLLILSPFLLRLWHLNQVVKVLERTDQALIDEIGSKLDQSFSGESAAYTLSSQLAGDLNEIRSLLLLPSKDYSNFEQQVLASEEDLKTGVYDQMTSLVESRKQAEKKEANESAFRALVENFGTFFSNPELTLGPLSEGDYLIYELKYQDQLLATLGLDKASGTFSLDLKYLRYETFSTKADWDKALQELALEDFAKLIADSRAYEQNISALDEYLASQEIKQVLAERKINFQKSENWPYLYTFQNHATEEIGKLEVSAASLTFKLDKQLFSDWETFKPALKSYLEKLETASLQEKEVANLRSELEDILNENAFQSYLADNNLSLAEARDNPDRIYYDILDSEQALIQSFVIDKATLEILVLGPAGNELMTFGSKKN